MKEQADLHLVRKLKDFTIYKEHFDKKVKEYNDRVGVLKEEGMNIETMGKKLESENFELIVLLDDLKRVASDIEVIVELFRKTNQDLPEDYKTITKAIPDFKEKSRLELFTFVIDDEKVVEREKGLLKTRLDLTKQSEAYNYYSKQK